jgi:class 3 adenylate cyclase
MSDGVNIAARLEGIAERGGICLSEDAWRQVRDRRSSDPSPYFAREIKTSPKNVYQERSTPRRSSPTGRMLSQRPMTEQRGCGICVCG